MKKKRKWLAALLAAVMVLTMVPAVTFAANVGDSFETENLTYKITGDNTVAVSDVSLEATSVTVPATVEHEGVTYKVTEVADSAFADIVGYKDNTTLTSITFAPDSNVTKIGNTAFAKCVALTSITLPDSEVTLGKTIFAGCDSLSSVIIPAKATLDPKTLSGDTIFGEFKYEENKITFEDGSKYKIQDGILYDEESLLNVYEVKENVVVPEGIKYIGDYAFASVNTKDDTLKSITLPSTLVSIGEYAFTGNSGLTSIVIPENVASIGGGAFANCSGVITAEIKGKLTEIPNGAFKGCTSLAEIDIPDTVTSIEQAAFSSCSSLKYIDIPSGVKIISEKAFEECTSLESINMPGVTSIENSAFNNCKALKVLELPSTVTSIGNMAFANCRNLETVLIPESVEKLGKNAFGNAFLDAETANLIFVGEVPPAIDTQLWVEKNKPTNLTIIVPTGSEEAYAGVNCLEDYLTDDENNTVQDQDYSLTLSDDIKVCPDDTAALDIKYELPVGAALEFSSDNENVLTVDDDGKVTGKAEGTAVVTAEITMNGIPFISDTCTVTVGHNFENGKCTLCGEEDPDYIPPVDPTDPTQPGAGEGDNQGGQNNDNQTVTTDKSAETGDDSNIVLLAGLLILAAAGATGTVIYGRKREEQ